MCTAVRFVDDNGALYFGRNLDHAQSYGEGIVFTPSGAHVTPGFERESDAQNGHAVIGVAIVVEGVPMYFDCGNDAGLAIAGLNFARSTRYAETPAEGRINVAAYEFPYWVGRNFSTLDEVCAALENTVIVGRRPNPNLPVSTLHWLIGDATGSAVVECREDGVRVIRNSLDVLTNEPPFEWHLQNARNYLALQATDVTTSRWGSAELSAIGYGTGTLGLPGDYSSPSRFIRAAFVNGNFPVKSGEDANVARMFTTLASVAMPEGSVRLQNETLEKTVYSCCFSGASLSYYWKISENPAVFTRSMGECDAGGTEPVVLARI